LKTNYKNSAVVGWLLSFALAMLLYWATLAPDLVWQDQGDYQYQAAKLVLNIPGDVVRVHPLFVIAAHYLGKLTPLSYAYSANLVSAFFSAVTVANIFLIVFLLAGRVWPAILGAGVLAFSHSFWFLGVQAQSYSMANAALTGGIIFLIKYLQDGRVVNLLLLGLVFGLGMAAHIMSQIGFAVIMVYLLVLCIQRKLAVKTYGLTVLAWTVGAFLLWVVMAIEYQRSGDFAGTVLSAIFGKWSSAVFNLGDLWPLVKNSILFFILNFPTPLVILAFCGIYLSFKNLSKEMSWILIISTILYCLFAIRYDVPNQNNFFLPMYMFVSIYIGLGFGFVFSRGKKLPVIITAILLFLIPPSYVAIAKTAKATKFNLGASYTIPYRNEYEYYLLGWQHNQTGPRRLLNEVFAVLPTDSIFLSDTTSYSIFQYAQEVEGLRRDVEIINGVVLNERIIGEMLKGKRVFTLHAQAKSLKWKIDSDWVKPLAISDTENIYEILIPKGK